MIVASKTRAGGGWLTRGLFAAMLLAAAAGGEPAAKNAVPAEPPAAAGHRDLIAHTAAQPAVGLDQALARAMDKNPGILAAKAKLAMAEAELHNAHYEAAWHVVSCWNAIKDQEQAAAAARQHLAVAEKQYNIGRLTEAELLAAKEALVEAEAKLSRSRIDLQFVTGQAPPSAAATLTSHFAPATGGAPRPTQVPHGPMVERIRQALLTPTQMEFVETPLKDVIDFLKDFHKIEIQLDEDAPWPPGFAPADWMITCNIKGMSLAAAFQLWDDKYRQLKLVVRDYGILVTTPGRVEEAGYMPVLEFARLPAGAERAAAEKAAAPAPPKGPAPNPSPPPPTGTPSK